MRRRRVARCILRAEVALSAGFEDDAGEALAEARRLDAETPTLEEIRARLDCDLVADAPGPRRRSWFAPAAAAALFTFAALSGWSGPYHVRTVPPPTAGAGLATAEPKPPARPGASVVVKTELLRATVQVAEASEPEPHPLARNAPVAASPEVRGAEPSAEPAPPVVRAPERNAEAVSIEARAPAASVPAFAPAAIPIVPLTADSPTSLAVAAPTPPLAVDPPRVVHRPAAAVETPPPAVNEVARVRSVLAQYERAYSSLDAKAARSVWPEVDERALARAFNGLESQRLTLGRCGVTVDGATAHASCSGSASWTPKVGTGRTEARRWSFTLQNARGVWRITHAVIGNS